MRPALLSCGALSALCYVATDTAIAAFRGWFRFHTAATIAILLLSAVLAFQYAPELQVNQPTPGLGLAERVGQYAYALWQSVLAFVLLPGHGDESR